MVEKVLPMLLFALNVPARNEVTHAQDKEYEGLLIFRAMLTFQELYLKKFGLHVKIRSHRLISYLQSALRNINIHIHFPCQC